MSLRPPEDWDFTIHDVRLVVDEARLPAGDRVAIITRMLYENLVTLEWYEGGTWQLIRRWPAYELPSGGLGMNATEDRAVRAVADARIFRPRALPAPQPVRAARTRVTFPGPAYIVCDGMDRGNDGVMFPVWSRHSPFILSTARNVEPEVPKGSRS